MIHVFIIYEETDRQKYTCIFCWLIRGPVLFSVGADKYNLANDRILLYFYIGVIGDGVLTKAVIQPRNILLHVPNERHQLFSGAGS